MEVGAAAAAAAGAAGAGLFSYNRGNYMMDAKNRYTRFTAGLNMAIAQTGMYRQDITDLTNLTVTRQDTYHVIAAMGLTILTAIYCPGRLGLHTPPPPGWLMGLGFVNIAGAYMFLGLTVWLCMHAAARADTAATHMLTRFVRLPIPSQGMLDKARKFASSYEEQPWLEMFRIPFTAHRNSGDDEAYNDDKRYDVDKDASRRARRGLDLPAWYRVEKEVSRANTIDTVESMMPLAGRGNAPEHFEAYRELQNEWFPYDVYSRLSIFLAFMHLTSCWTFMQIGHALTETRALWACAIVVLQMFSLQQIILTLDIIPSGYPVHRIGPFSFWFAYIACALEYKRWYTPEAQWLGFILVWCAYGIEIIYTVWLLRICAPSKDPPPVAEVAAGAWWPSEWLLPTSFQHALWLVAPPKELEKGQNDIAGELRDQQRNIPGSPTVARQVSSFSDRRADAVRALGKHKESPAWWNVQIGLLAMLVAWVFMTAGFTVEVMYQGTSTPSFLSAPGLPNNARDPRYRPAKVGGREPVEVGTGGLSGPARGVHMGAMHRRLADLHLTPESASEVDQVVVAQALHSLMPRLHEIAHGRSQEQTSRAHSPDQTLLAPAASTEPTRLKVQWPVLFEPEFLTCGTDSPAVMAMSRHGRGCLITKPHEHEAIVPGPRSFILEGVAGQGPVAAASWDSKGLLLVTATGVAMECPGDIPAANGRWHCTPLPGSKLPITAEGKMVATRVAIARARSEGLRAAVLFPGDNSVTIFSRSSQASAHWLPSGEVSISAPMAAASFTAGAETLLLTAADGTVTHVNMGTGLVSVGAPPVPGSENSWLAACQSSAVNLARLSQEVGKSAELVLG